MKRYRVAPESLADIDEIIIYIARDSRQNALNVWDRLEDAFAKLAEHPGLGHIREDLGDDSVRVFNVYDYLIIYDPVMRPLMILRVVHGSRDLSRIKLSKPA
jgi:toxin ParE1/3/4